MDAQQAAAVSALGAAYAARQRTLVANFVAELVSLIRQVFRPDDPARSWDATQLAVSALVQRYHRTSATMGARYYLDARRASGVAGARRAGPLPRIEDMTDDQVWDELGRIAGVGPEDLDEERIDATVRATGIASYQRSIRAGRSPQRAAGTMTTTLAGATQEWRWRAVGVWCMTPPPPTRRRSGGCGSLGRARAGGARCSRPVALSTGPRRRPDAG